MMKTYHSLSPSLIIAAMLALFSAMEVNAQATSEKTAETPQQLVAKAEQAFDESDIIAAISYYRKAAQAGYIPAINRLAYLLDQSEENEEAIKWYRLSAEQGDAEAEHGLAGMYVSGDGIAQDIDEALRLFTSSADKGYAPAIHVMAAAYEKGSMGLRIDYELAREWLDKGVQQNDYWSIKRLSQAYARGELGLRIDRQKAAQLEQHLARLKQDSD